MESTILLDSTILWESNIKNMVAIKKEAGISPAECQGIIRPVRDALEVLNGKWKLAIIGSLTFGTKRFKQISKEVTGITDKVLSKELKDLEINQLIKREVFDTFPPTVEYSITSHGKSLEKVINELRIWGLSHRKKIIGK